MIDIKLLRDNPEEIKKGIAAKNADPKLVDDFLQLDKKWRELTKAAEELRAKQNILSKERKIDEAKENKAKLKEVNDELTKVADDRKRIYLMIPNPPSPDAPIGKDDTANVTLREVGKKPKFSFEPKDYLTLAEKLGIIDVKRAAKVSGSRFGYLIGDAAMLEFALGQLILHTLRKKGFVPIIPPVMVNEKSMRGMGYVERGGEEIYRTKEDGLYLIGTSEQAIGPMHQDETFQKKDLPKRYIAFSTCFRREAGSYGKDTKGILRVHQFDKFEMFSITVPEKSEEEHELLLAIEEELMQKLGLPYRVQHIATGDLGDPASAKYDIEAWMPGQNEGKGEYRETHSTSNTSDFQSRRLGIKYKDGAESKYVHMLNGTGFAIGRMLIAIIENYQNKDGSITVPKALRKYAGIKKIKL